MNPNPQTVSASTQLTPRHNRRNRAPRFSRRREGTSPTWSTASIASTRCGAGGAESLCTGTPEKLAEERNRVGDFPVRGTEDHPLADESPARRAPSRPTPSSSPPGRSSPFASPSGPAARPRRRRCTMAKPGSARPRSGHCGADRASPRIASRSDRVRNGPRKNRQAGVSILYKRNPIRAPARTPRPSPSSHSPPSTPSTFQPLNLESSPIKKRENGVDFEAWQC